MQEFPKMVYHGATYPDGETRIVQDDAELGAALAEGWRRSPASDGDATAQERVTPPAELPPEAAAADDDKPPRSRRKG